MQPLLFMSNAYYHRTIALRNNQDSMEARNPNSSECFSAQFQVSIEQLGGHRSERWTREYFSSGWPADFTPSSTIFGSASLGLRSF